MCAPNGAITCTFLRFRVPGYSFLEKRKAIAAQGLAFDPVTTGESVLPDFTRRTFRASEINGLVALKQTVQGAYSSDRSFPFARPGN